MGIWHPLPLATAATIMGIGFWTFIANILLSVRQKHTEGAPADGKLKFFIAFAAAALLVGTVQGVIQILEPVKVWLDDALPASYFVTPLSHAQLNMVGFVIVSLATMSLFLLPRIIGKEVADRKEARVALAVMSAGIVATYVVYFVVGLLESLAIHQGLTPSEAIDSVAGQSGRYFLMLGAQAILGLGYLLFFRHVGRLIGRDAVRAYFRTIRGRLSGAGQQWVRIHPRVMPADMESAQRRALGAALIEAFAGAIGFLGMGWILSGRPLLGILMLGSWAGGFWTFVYVVFAVAGGAQLLPFVLVPYFIVPVLSAIGCYRSFVRESRANLTVNA
jgi:cytochrome c oxidase cbb3-type subunit 1